MPRSKSPDQRGQLPTVPDFLAISVRVTGPSCQCKGMNISKLAGFTSLQYGAEPRPSLLTRNQGWARHWEVLGRALEGEESPGRPGGQLLLGSYLTRSKEGEGQVSTHSGTLCSVALMKSLASSLR
jgi:hypothetical protein